MMLLRTPLVAALAAAAALAVGVPAAGASTGLASPAQFQGTPIGGLSIPASIPGGGCVTSSIEGQARTGGNAIQACLGAGLSFIAPATNVSSVVGPTIITPAFVGTSIVSGGNVAIGP
jgi:hypothetical protein